MARPTNQQLKEIKQRATKIGLLYQFSISSTGKLTFPKKKSKLFGHEVILKHPDLVKEWQKEGKTFNPKEEYLINTDVMIEQNHFRAMKRIFEKNGWEGISQYERDVRSKQVKMELYLQNKKR